MRFQFVLAITLFLIPFIYSENSNALDYAFDITFTALGFQDNSGLSDEREAVSANLNYHGIYDFGSGVSFGFDGEMDIGLYNARHFRYEVFEFYLKKIWSSAFISFGRTYTGWKQDDIYSPTDFIAQREFSPVEIGTSQLGHTMAKFKYFGESSTFELAVSEFRQPRFDSIYNSAVNSPKIDEDLALFDGDEKNPNLQVFLRQSWSSSLGDFAIVLGHGYESFPALSPRFDPETFAVVSLVPNYRSGFKLGVFYSSEIGDTGFLSDFEGVILDRTLANDFKRVTAGIFRTGLEKEIGINSIIKGSSITFKGNIFFDTRKERSLAIYNSDIDFAVNWNLGDWNSSVITSNLLYDYESREKIVALSLSRKIFSNGRITAEYSNSFDSRCNKCAIFNFGLKLFF